MVNITKAANSDRPKKIHRKSKLTNRVNKEKIYGNRLAYAFLTEKLGKVIGFSTFNSYVSLRLVPHSRDERDPKKPIFDADELLEWAKTRRNIQKRNHAESIAS